MACLASVVYDPAASVSKQIAPAAVMAPIDGALTLPFVVPTNKNVLCRMRGVVHGSTTWPLLLFGVMQQGVIKGRQVPIGGLKGASSATIQEALEAAFIATDPVWTPGDTVQLDAAMSVQTAGSGSLKMGGPDDAVTNNAFGQFAYDIWDTPGLLAFANYDPATAVVASSGALLPMTALDTTNLRLSFAPTSSKVLVRLRCPIGGASTFPVIHLGLLDGSTVIARQQPIGALTSAALASQRLCMEALFVVGGLTTGNTYTWDAAYAVEVAVASTGICYGGPDSTSQFGFGGFTYEIWTA